MTDKPLAEKAATWERPLDAERDHRSPVVNPPAEPELADDDLLIERKDLGEESATFVAKGDPIPAELRELPRRAARPAPRKR
jgi:hypothetical protein